MIKNILEVFGVTIIVLLLAFSIPVSLCWFSSARNSKLYNAHFGTNYTAADFFWAGSTIKDYIHKGEQKTHNIKL